MHRKHRRSSSLRCFSAFCVRSLGEDYKADFENPFDFLLLEISPDSLALIAEEADLPAVSVLNTVNAHPDPVLANLARALTPALEDPQGASRLFVDQLTAAIGTHVVQNYGDRSVSGVSKSRKLTRLQESVAKTMILANLHGNVSIADLAQACNLSRGYFIHAFRQAVGMTPYQWLLRERISRARALLLETDAAFLRFFRPKPLHPRLLKRRRHNAGHLAAQRLNSGFSRERSIFPAFCPTDLTI